jgi:glucose-1-phosphate thymidylyltransferase
MIGIILAGGRGTRMYPFDSFTSKHLLPIYDKPLIYYSISTLMLIGIKNILIVVSKNHLDDFKKILLDGSQFGIKINFIEQDQPKGIVHALKICQKYIKKRNFVLYLGDNIFYGHGIIDIFNKAKKIIFKLSSVFTYKTTNPKAFGILKKDNIGNMLKIYEKPLKYISDEAVTGIYFYNNQVLKFIKKIKYSKRKELEISDLNNLLISKKKLKYFYLGRGSTWYDCGSIDEMVTASNFFYEIEQKQGDKIYCPEEVSYNKNWISKKKLKNMLKNLKSSNYKKYLLEKVLVSKQ